MLIAVQVVGINQLSLLVFSFDSLCVCVNRADSGPEDWNSEEGRTAVLHEDVHGLPPVFHLPHEVCVSVLLFLSADFMECCFSCFGMTVQTSTARSVSKAYKSSSFTKLHNFSNARL